MWWYLRLMKKWDWARNRSIKKMRTKVADPRQRAMLNDQYNKLTGKGWQLFHRLYAKIFRDITYPVSEGEWKVYFMKKEIVLPLRKEHIWLDWDVAVSVLGHDPEIKKTYEDLIRSGHVKLFFDIGANYGTHSLLFLVNGIKTIAFEPNSSLKKEFDLYCRLNNVTGSMENLALGDKNGIVNFWFQPHETWNGSIVDTVVDKLKDGEQPVKLEVVLTTLDDYVQQNNLQPTLLKIDTEGNEINVLKGAIKTISTARPFILFETNAFEERAALWSFFNKSDYLIYTLPYSPFRPGPVLSEQQFLIKWANNYIAVPAKKQT